MEIQISSMEKTVVLPKTTEPLILIGDVMEKLKILPDKCIDIIITSPPYFGQRDYETEGQIGQEERIEEYINKMIIIGKELRRVLKDTGSYFLNIGDKYIKKRLMMIPERTALGLQKNGWILRNIITWYKPNHMPSSIKDRLANVSEPIYFFIKDLEKYYTPDYYVNLDEIRVPHKNNGDETKNIDFPEVLSEQEYKERDWERKIKLHNEQMRRRYNGKFNGEKINMGASPGARKSLGISYSKQRVHNISIELELEILNYLREKRKEGGISTKQIDKIFNYKDTAGHWFRLDKGGRSLPKSEDWDKLKEILKLDDRYDKTIKEQHYVLQTIKNHRNGKNPGDLWVIPQEEDFFDSEDIWKIPLERVKEAHFAIFPTALPHKIIKAFCPKDGIVLDPFAGSGTTGRAAKILNRKSILIDINPEYEEIMRRRCLNIKVSG